MDSKSPQNNAPVLAGKQHRQKSSFTMNESSTPRLPPKAKHEQEQEGQHSPPEEEENHDNIRVEGSTSSFMESIRKVFAPCVGVVDAASLIMGNCRGAKDPACEPYDLNHHGGDPLDIVTRLRERNAALNKTIQKRQGETLEFPANGGFDDDVSAISAHTLEEMERLHMSGKGFGHLHLMPKKSRKASTDVIPSKAMNGHNSRVAFTNKQLWTMQRPMHRTKNDLDNLSNGVSTSGSESSAEAEATTLKVTTKGGKVKGHQTYLPIRMG